MGFIEVLITLLFGLIEGITEWLPISSTGHMILVEEFIKLSKYSIFEEEFVEVFLVVIQLGAILAVALSFFKKLFPFDLKAKKKVDLDKFNLWGKIIVASLPAALIGIPFEDKIDEMFFNFQTVAVTLIVYGILFIVIENWNKGKTPKYGELKDITYLTALLIGVFQLMSLIPGTSRSGATIVGALLLGVSRLAATEFTFFLAIPAMAGASLIKLVKHGFGFSIDQYMILILGMLSAFVVSIIVIKFLVSYIKKHDFKVFGYYRIILGVVLIAYMLL